MSVENYIHTFTVASALIYLSGFALLLYILNAKVATTYINLKADIEKSEEKTSTMAASKLAVTVSEIIKAFEVREAERLSAVLHEVDSFPHFDALMRSELSRMYEVLDKKTRGGIGTLYITKFTKRLDDNLQGVQHSKDVMMELIYLHPTKDSSDLPTIFQKQAVPLDSFFYKWYKETDEKGENLKKTLDSFDTDQETMFIAESLGETGFFHIKIHDSIKGSYHMAISFVDNFVASDNDITLMRSLANGIGNILFEHDFVNKLITKGQ